MGLAANDVKDNSADNAGSGSRKGVEETTVSADILVKSIVLESHI